MMILFAKRTRWDWLSLMNGSTFSHNIWAFVKRERKRARRQTERNNRLCKTKLRLLRRVLYTQHTTHEHSTAALNVCCDFPNATCLLCVFQCGWNIYAVNQQCFYIEHIWTNAARLFTVWNVVLVLPTKCYKNSCGVLDAIFMQSEFALEMSTVITFNCSVLRNTLRVERVRRVELSRSFCEYGMVRLFCLLAMRLSLCTLYTPNKGSNIRWQYNFRTKRRGVYRFHINYSTHIVKIIFLL